MSASVDGDRPADLFRLTGPMSVGSEDGETIVLTFPTAIGGIHIGMDETQIADLIAAAGYVLCPRMPKEDESPRVAIPVIGLMVGWLEDGSVSITFAITPEACLPFRIPASIRDLLLQALQKA
jgi:hypothetical protein